jgi:hypothetical protein
MVVHLIMKSKGFSMILLPLIATIIVLLAIVYVSSTKESAIMVSEKITTPIPNVKQTPLSSPTVLATPTATAKPRNPEDNVYSYGTFSFSYPKTWKLIDSKMDNSFFANNKIDIFDHMILLQKDGHYFVVGIDNPTQGAQVGGAISAGPAYEEFMRKNDEVSILGQKYYLSKAQTPLSSVNDPNSSAGVWSFASFAKIFPNQTVKNNLGPNYDGLEYYFTEGQNTYAFLKLSDSSYLTPASIQSDLLLILESIVW